MPTYSVRTPAVRPHACPPPTVSAVFLTAIAVSWAEGDDGGSSMTGFILRPTGGGEEEQVRCCMRVAVGFVELQCIGSEDNICRYRSQWVGELLFRAPIYDGYRTRRIGTVLSLSFGAHVNWDGRKYHLIALRVAVWKLKKGAKERARRKQLSAFTRAFKSSAPTAQTA